jgi:hypothetical protein
MVAFKLVVLDTPGFRGIGRTFAGGFAIFPRSIVLLSENLVHWRVLGDRRDTMKIG